MSTPAPRIAVLIPCLDEAATIGKVVADFRRELPQATVYVFDNNSADDTAELARASGALVGFEPRAGKGYVIERMLARVDADVFLLVDGDDTYPAESARDLLQPVLEGRADMVIGARLAQPVKAAFRPLHILGNRLVRTLINRMFGAQLTDIMSGYRAFNRRVAEQLPVVSAGFEIETAMTVHLLYLRAQMVEVQVPYRARPTGSESKLRTVRDGARVLWTIFTLFREVKPLTFFGSLATLFFLAGCAAGLPTLMGYLNHPKGYLQHLPLAVAGSALMVIAAISLVLGILLHAINWRIRELHNVVTRPHRASSHWRPTHPHDIASTPDQGPPRE